MKTRGFAYWAKITSLDTKYNQWKVELHVSKEEAAKLEAVGLKPKKKVIEDADGNDKVVTVINIARRLIRRGKKGGQNDPPVCVDAATNPFEGEIGNGSEVIVKHKPYNWANKDYGKGVGTDLQGVQIINLVEYVAPEGTEDEIIDDDDDDGFEVLGEGISGSSVAPEPEGTKSDDIPY